MWQSVPLNWRLAFRGMLLCFGLGGALVSTAISASEIELDDETLSSFRRHVEKHSYKCGSVRDAHILYEDEIVLVVELLCDDRVVFEIVNLLHRNVTFVDRLENTSDDALFRKGKAAYENGSFSQAHELIKPLAENGHAEAQLILGDLYNAGKGVAQDNAAAVVWFHKAAEQGNVDAQFMLGHGMRLQR